MTESALKIEYPSWWKRRPRTEKILYIIVGVLILLIIIILSINFSMHPQGSHNVCLTPSCVKTASEILENMDANVDPCENFYQFACGNFIKTTLIPDDKYWVSQFTILGDKVVDAIHTLIKKPISNTDIRPFALAKTLFQACTNTSRREETSLKNFKAILKKMGGWPVTELQWNEEEFDWISTNHKFMKQGLTSNKIVNIYVDTNVTNSSRYSLHVDQIYDSLNKIKRNGFNETVFQAYYGFMIKVAVAFGAEEEQAAEEMKDVAELVINLAEISVPDEQRRNSSLENNPYTIQELENEFGYVPWLTYINTMLDPYKKMTYDDIVTVKVPSYYEKLENVLNETSKRTVANYMYWSAVESMISDLNEGLINIQLEYNKVSAGLSERSPKWKECFATVADMFQIAVSALYVKNFFNKESKNSVTEMVHQIKDQFTEVLKQADWMDKETKKQALDKAKVMNLHLAYPDELLDDKKLEQYYENVTLDASDYIGSLLNLSLFFEGLSYKEKLVEQMDKKDWRNHAYVARVNAFYNSNENSIGILQDVFFEEYKPKYMNYGAIGHVVGHEITHGFDDQGRQIDKQGNLKNWWDDETRNRFDKKVQCLIHQYGNVTEPEVELNLNAINTQGENIADNGGVKIAYLAYKEWSRKNGEEQTLPGLLYSPEQMFWIAFANVWCRVERSEALKIEILTETHAPSRYRVNLSLMNSKYFSEDFKCHKNSKMNPEHKCTVW